MMITIQVLQFGMYKELQKEKKINEKNNVKWTGKTTIMQK